MSYTNRATNPSLETDFGGWSYSPGGTATRKTEFPKDGMWSAGWGGTADPGVYLVMSSTYPGRIPVVAGEQLAIRVSVTKLLTWPGPGARLYLRVIYFDASTAVVADRSGLGQGIEDGVERDLVAVDTVPAGAVNAEIRADWLAGPGTGFEVRLDALLVLRAAPGTFTIASVPLYFAGTIDEGYWGVRL